MTANLGLNWKRYWRDTGSGLYHCFVSEGRRWVSLCGERTIASTGGQAMRRPICVKRCGRCDIMEIKGCKAEESLPCNDGSEES